MRHKDSGPSCAAQARKREEPHKNRLFAIKTIQKSGGPNLEQRAKKERIKAAHRRAAARKEAAGGDDSDGYVTPDPDDIINEAPAARVRRGMNAKKAYVVDCLFLLFIFVSCCAIRLFFIIFIFFPRINFN